MLQPAVGSQVLPVFASLTGFGNPIQCSCMPKNTWCWPGRTTTSHSS